MAEEGRYIYCIIGTDEEKSFGPVGIGGQGDEVYTVCYRSQAAVISSSPVIKYPITRENTMAHQTVLEELMKEYTVLPVRFGTIAEGKPGASAEERIKEQVLKGRYQEFEDLLKEMHNKVELGVKALWTDVNTVFQEIVQENAEIRRMRRRVLRHQARGDAVSLGELVKSALDAKRNREAREILKDLKPICADHRINKTFGDRMIMNAAFLVDTQRGDKFDREVNRLQTSSDGRMKLKYVGPVPILNFVEIVITWQD